MVSTPLKNISQNGNLPQVGVKRKNIWNHHLVDYWGTQLSKTLCQRGSCYFLPKFSLHHMRKCERNTPSVEKDLLKEISLSHKIEFRCEYVWYLLTSPKKPGLFVLPRKNTFQKTCLTTGQDQPWKSLKNQIFGPRKPVDMLGSSSKDGNFASEKWRNPGGKPQAISPGSRWRRIGFGMLWGRYFAMLWV